MNDQSNYDMHIENLKSRPSFTIEFTHRSDLQPKSRRTKAAKDNSLRKDETRNPFQVILTAEQAKSIYSLRASSTVEDHTIRHVVGKSSLVAEMYGVSPKTIRDVWNRKTWSQVLNFVKTPHFNNM